MNKVNLIVKKIFLVQLFALFVITISKAQTYHWQTVGTTGITAGTPSDGVVFKGKIYVSGSFQEVDGLSVNNFAVITGENYSEIGAVPGSKTYGFGYSIATNTVYALTADSPTYLYGQTDTGEWASIPITFNAQPMFIYGINDSEVIISGEFTIVNGITANYVCLWNAVTNTVTDIGGLPGPDNIGEMCMFLGKLLIPYYVPSTNDPHFKELDLSTMSLDDDTELMFSHQILYSFLADSDRLYMSYLGIMGTNQIARFENGSWSVIGTFDGWGASGLRLD